MNKATFFLGMAGMLGCLTGCSQQASHQQKSITVPPDKGLPMADDYTCVKSASELVAMFPQTIAEIDRQKEYAIAQVERGIAAILAVPDEDRTFENTARAYDRVLANYSCTSGPIYALKMVSPDDELREHAQKVLEELGQFTVEAFYHVDIYHALKAYHAGGATRESLTAEERYFIDETVQDLARMGLGMGQKTLDTIKEIKKKLARHSLSFSANIAQDQSHIMVPKEALAGLKQSFIDGLALEGDQYKLTVDYPTYFEVMEHCSVASTRQQLYYAYSGRAYPQNKKVLEDIIAYRDELAHVLNFSSYAQLDLDDQMIENPARAYEFIHDLLARVKAKEKQEFAEFTRELPPSVTLTADGVLEPWDLSYVKSSYKKKHFDIDERYIAEFFPLEKTIEGLFAIYQQFFDLTFEHKKVPGLWHEDVSLIDVVDNQTGSRIGSVLIDLHPRPHKYSHACHLGLISAIDYVNAEGVRVQRPSVALVIANFPKPTAAQPSLLKHSDVTTFFHEFGHALHAILGRTSLASLSGTAVKTDFVELPSQMLENWMWQQDILKSVSSHYQTGEPLPSDLIEKMVALKKFDSGMFVQRQCALSLVSLDYYGKGRVKDTDALLKKIWQEQVTSSRFDDKNHFQASFGHLTGYGAKYYSYMLSRVWAQDVFEQVKKEGLLSAAAGRRLINEILGKGGSIDPNVLLRNYLGREPKIDPFLKDLGIR